MLNPSYELFCPAQKLLLGIAMGDAFGAPYEGKTRDIINHEADFSRYYHLKGKPRC